MARHALLRRDVFRVQTTSAPVCMSVAVRSDPSSHVGSPECRQLWPTILLRWSPCCRGGGGGESLGCASLLRVRPLTHRTADCGDDWLRRQRAKFRSLSLSSSAPSVPARTAEGVLRSLCLRRLRPGKACRAPRAFWPCSFRRRTSFSTSLGLLGGGVAVVVVARLSVCVLPRKNSD